MRTLYVCHGFYGCDTGCCGHRLALDDEGDERVPNTFQFAHPREGQTAEQFAREVWVRSLQPDDVILPGKWFCTTEAC